MKIKNKKINKLLFKKEPLNKGIALLFTIMLSTIFLTMALGVTNIATKELTFSSSAKDSNNAFYSAESGIECALYNDKATSTFFLDPNQGVDINDPANVEINGGSVNLSGFSCFGNPVTLTGDFPNFSFVISGLGSNSNSCAKVVINKIIDRSVDSAIVVSTKITSNGYNIGDDNCDYSGLNRVERVLEVNY